jgi:phosphoribosylformylglycinamidine synthase
LRYFENTTFEKEQGAFMYEGIRRVYVEKRADFAVEAERLKADLIAFLGNQYPELNALTGVRILRRYDVSGLSTGQFERAVAVIFSEQQCDTVFYGSPVPASTGEPYFNVAYAEGQYDQRSDSAEQCAELVFATRPAVRTASVYILQTGGQTLSDAAFEAVKRYIINPVDSCEATDELPRVLAEVSVPLKETSVLDGFTSAATEALADMARRYRFAMSPNDLLFCQTHFASIKRDPTLTELRVLDTYWSDHCRHTTFTTELAEIKSNGTALRKALDLYETARQEVYGCSGRPRTLMDIATIGAKVLKKRGLLDDLDESPEINACTIKINAEFDDGTTEPYLLLFKNETHNHPTEIEPFGGAATCLGGAIRDPLSGRAYVHQAMRISGTGDPRQKSSGTLSGKLPQVKIARESAAGYASYGNQIGLATGQVAELYHQGFVAKHLELGAVIAAVPARAVRREEPAAGDLVLLIGGKTGRDGIGGATGSSKVHTGESVGISGAEVQKGNPVEERKIQRLFRNPAVTLLIKRCNDFGAGGVAVAVGEIAEGLDINLDAVPRKYAGLDGTEIAISESQERMAVVVDKEDAAAFIRHAARENLDAVVIATVTGDNRLRMFYQGQTIVDLSRALLSSNGAPRQTVVQMEEGELGTGDGGEEGENVSASVLLDKLERELVSLRSGSRRGLQERFDGSVGAGSVLFPFGGSEQGTPECGMAALLPALDKQSCTASLMAFGFDPDVMSVCPYEGAKGAIREALAKFACLGGNPFTARLSLQEYFERPDSAESWGKPLAALLGALEAQLALGVPAIGGKDSMSGTYAEQDVHLTVPPTLVAFAAGITPASTVRSGALSGEKGNRIVLLAQGEGDEWGTFKANMRTLAALSEAGLVRAAYPVGAGGIAATLAVMAFGSMAGVEVRSTALKNIRRYQGSVLLELAGENPSGIDQLVGQTVAEPVFRITHDDEGAEVALAVLRRAYESPLAAVYPQSASGARAVPLLTVPLAKPLTGTRHAAHTVQPLVVLPVFPGTNCEWDMERAFRKAGARTRLIIFRNHMRDAIAESIEELAEAINSAQIVALSGGFSAGDEPDGSGKFIANVFRAPRVLEAVTCFLERDSLMLGICNGFQALIKLGLVPGAGSLSTLTFNRIGRHVSRMVRTRVMSSLSPWLALEGTDAISVIPVSHGEGRLVVGQEDALFKSGQVAFCYVDAEGQPTMAEPDNPNGSCCAIEGLTSADGRILGKMGHSERSGDYVHVNIPGNKRQRIFEAGVRYFC